MNVREPMSPPFPCSPESPGPMAQGRPQNLLTSQPHRGAVTGGAAHSTEHARTSLELSVTEQNQQQRSLCPPGGTEHTKRHPDRPAVRPATCHSPSQLLQRGQAVRPG